MQIKKAQVLMVSIFLMLALSMIAWTVVNMATLDTQMSSRSLDSERALYIAEAGLGWAKGQLSENSSWIPLTTDNLPHRFGAGEYDVTATAANGVVQVVSTGYIPSKNICTSAAGVCRASRSIQTSVPLGTVNKFLHAKNYFDWSEISSYTAAAYRSEFNGDIAVSTGDNSTGYERDGDSTHNELNVDYGPSLPYSSNASYTRTLVDASTFPEIDLEDCESGATSTWPPSSWLALNGWDGVDSTKWSLLLMPWATVPVGDVGGVEYDYAQSFSPSNNLRFRYLEVLHGDTIGITTLVYPKVGDYGGSEYDCRQSFIAPNYSDSRYRSLYSISIFHNRTYGTPVGRITVSILDANGTQVTSGTYRPSANRWNTITFNNRNRRNPWSATQRIVLNPGATYYIVFDAVDQANNNYYTLGAGTYANGVMAQRVNGTWGSDEDNDTAFRINFQAGNSIAASMSQQVSDQITVRLYTDNSGSPGTLITGDSGGGHGGVNMQTTYTPIASSWNLVTFPDQATLSRNTTYWLVWDLGDQNNNCYYTLRLAKYDRGIIKYRNGSSGSWQTPYSAGEPDIAFRAMRTSSDSNPTAGVGNYVYVSQPNYFYGMSGEALRNYGKNGNWADNEWAVINSVADVASANANSVASPGGAYTRAYLDRDVIYNDNYLTDDASKSDWYDDEDAALTKRFSGSNSTQQSWYISAGMVMDATSGTANYPNFSAVSERDIGLLGDNTISMKVGTNTTRPLIATKDGDIYSSRPYVSGIPKTDVARRKYEGMIYSKNGDVSFDYVCGNASVCSSNGVVIAGHNIYAANYAWLNYNANFTDCDCITGRSTAENAYSWSEK